MAVPYYHAIQSGSLIKLINNTPKLREILYTPHIKLVDNYESTFKHFGFERPEMMVVLPILMRVDPLVGIENLPYIETNINKK